MPFLYNNTISENRQLAELIVLYNFSIHNKQKPLFIILGATEKPEIRENLISGFDFMKMLSGFKPLFFCRAL